MLRYPLDPWEEFAVIHGGELLEDGRPRFRILLIIVARQNGKTTLCVVNTAYWQAVDGVPLILGTSTKLDYAKESWSNACKVITRAARRDDPEARDLSALIPRDSKGAPKWTRRTNGEQESWLWRDPDNPDPDDVSRYKIGTADESGGRSLTINRLVCDELRQHHDYSAWHAAEPATSAVWDAEIWALSNAGDARSVVLNELREQALHFIETGEGDPRVGIMEWSAPDETAAKLIAGQPVSDEELCEAIACANPNVGHRPYPGAPPRKDPEVLFRAARHAIAKGGDVLNGYLTESLCVNVQRDNPAIDPARWRACYEDGDLSELRDRVALVWDVAPDEQHATLVAAARTPDGRVRVEVVESWEDPTHGLRALPTWLERVKPSVFGWIPDGPAAAYATRLKMRDGRHPAAVMPWIRIEEIRAEVPDVCMGFAAAVKAGTIVHANDPLLTAQAGAATRRKWGERWVFSRARAKDGDAPHVDAVYAAAGAAHLALTLEPPRERRGLITSDDE